MIMRTSADRGFTLIELLITMSIFAFLVIVAGPQYADFMGNMQIRNGAENALTGLRVAQSEAVRGNTLAQVVLDASAAGGWQVLRLNDETNAFDIVVQSYQWADGASKTTVTPAGVSVVTFDGLGRIMPTNPANGTQPGSAPIAQLDITNINVANPRPLRVVINPATPSGVKLCDPDPGVAAFDPTDPRVCPT
jgi:type IV fimbrial biogenesis protein FimT